MIKRKDQPSIELAWPNEEEVRCTLCDNVSQHMSTGNKNLCKQCYSDVMRYRRYIDYPEPKESHVQEFIDRMRRMFDASHERFGYVPECYYTVAQHQHCEYCDGKFLSRRKTKKCGYCVRKEQAYRTLHAHNEFSYKLVDYDDYYRQMLQKGLKVPKLYHERNK